MKKKYNYVYVTTNLINGKQYVGSHSTNRKNDNYLGSRIVLIEAVQKYGRKNFIREILLECNTIEEARLLEETNIKKYNTLSPNGYNLSPTGGICLANSYHSEETKRKIGKANKGNKHTQELKNRLSSLYKDKSLEEIYGKEKAGVIKNKLKEKIKERKEKGMYIHPNKGKQLSEKWKENISRGGKNSYTEERKRKHSKRMSGKNNPSYGISPPKIECIYCKKNIDKRNYARWHGEKCKSKT